MGDHMDIRIPSPEIRIEWEGDQVDGVAGTTLHARLAPKPYAPIAAMAAETVIPGSEVQKSVANPSAMRNGRKIKDEHDDDDGKTASRLCLPDHHHSQTPPLRQPSGADAIGSITSNLALRGTAGTEEMIVNTPATETQTVEPAKN